MRRETGEEFRIQESESRREMLVLRGELVFIFWRGFLGIFLFLTRSGGGEYNFGNSRWRCNLGEFQNFDADFNILTRIFTGFHGLNRQDLKEYMSIWVYEWMSQKF